MKKKDFENLLEKIKTLSNSFPEIAKFLRSDEVFDLTKKMSTEQRTEFLCFPIVEQDSIHAGLIVADAFLRAGGLEKKFTHITRKLSVQQRFKLLQVKLTNPQNIEFGNTLAMTLIERKRNEDFTHLTQGLSVEQRFELLQAKLTNPQQLAFGITLAMTLIMCKQYEDFTHLTQGLSVEQRFELLQANLNNPQHLFFDMTLAMTLIMCKQYEDFTRLTQGLSVEKRFKLLQVELTNAQNVRVGITLAWTIIFRKRYEDFTRLTQGLSVEQRFELLRAKLTNAQNADVGATLAMTLILHTRYEDFTRLTQGLSVEQRFELLRVKLTNAQNADVGVTLAMTLILHTRYEDFTRLIQGFSGKEIAELTDNNNHAFAILKILCQRKQINILNDVLDQCDYESLQTIYNRLADGAIETEFVVFNCFQKLDLLFVSNILGKTFKNEMESEFKNILSTLFAYQHQITKPDLKKQSLEYLQSLLWEITKSRQCVTWTYEVFNAGKTLNEEEQDAFDSLKKISKREAIDNFGFYLSILNVSDGKYLDAKVLALRHAEMLEAAVTKSTYANVLESLGELADRSTLHFQDDSLDKKTGQGEKRKVAPKTVPGKERSLDLQKSIKLS